MALGDTIEKVATVTRIKHVVTYLSKAVDLDCGCEKRKETLNNPNLLINKILYKDGISNEGSSL